MKRIALGRGLDALMPETGVPTQVVQEIDVDRIDPNPLQPRRRVEDESLQELAESIRQTGLLQPVIVRRKGDRFELIAGERRWRAAILAGHRRVPAIVRDVSDEASLVLALIENIQRRDLNPVEEAQAYQTMIREFHLTQEEVAERVGKPRATVANYLRLLRLPPEVLQLLAEGTLTMGHAKVLLSLDDTTLQVRLARRVVAEGWSVRRLEQWVGARPQRRRARPPALLDPDWQVAIQRLQRYLGARVEALPQRRGGILLRIYFPDWEAVDRFYRQVLPSTIEDIEPSVESSVHESEFTF